MNSFKTKKSEVGKRLDLALSERYPERSRSYWNKAIDKKHVNVNDKPVKSGYKLSEKDYVRVDIPKAEKKPMEVPIVYDDEEVVVFNKPEGLIVHDKDNFSNEFTVVDLMKNKFNGAESRNCIVHRLDRTTSGVIVCAKNDDVADYLKDQFAKRNVEKEYLAISSGNTEVNEAIIDLPIKRNPKAPHSFRVGANGKESQTRYKIIETQNGLHKVQLSPTTGRTHQLRVHLSYIGLPILGDELYGGRSASRLMLHARKLSIKLPSAGPKVFTVEPPESFHYE